MLRALKRITLLLLAFVAVMAATLYLLYFRRTPLPPAAPHEHTVPVISAIPGLSACWVETAKTFSSFPFGSTDRKSTRLNSSHGYISYAVFCLKKKTK